MTMDGSTVFRSASGSAGMVRMSFSIHLSEDDVGFESGCDIQTTDCHEEPP